MDMKMLPICRQTFLSLSLIFLAACSAKQNSHEEEAQSVSGKPSDTIVSTQDANGYASVSGDGYGAVASVHPLATAAGLKAFEQGGNAIDAAVATALTLGVVDSQNSGIGGGCFVLVRWADGTISAIDGREMAPGKAHRDLFIRDGVAQPQLSKTGPLASGVPGSLKAFEAILKRGGKLSLSDALQAGITHADNGFAIDRLFAKRLARTADAISQFPSTSAIFLKPDGSPFEEGEVVVQKDLANTYRAIATQGASHFYGGEYAKKVEAWMQQNGGIITADDFSHYRLAEREPVKSQYRGYEVYGFPPPSSGGVHVAQILNILESFDVKSLSDEDRYHLLAEAMKLAFADRAHWLGDPDYTKVPTGLMSEVYAKDLAKRVSLERATPVQGHGTPPLSDEAFFKQLNRHTTHISAADKDGNWVAITSTINTSFGSKVVVPGTGVLLNNQMDDFSIKVGEPNAFNLVGAEANSVQAGKRPLSSMSPTVVLKGGQPVLTLGAAGGPTIINQVVQTLVNYIDLAMPLQKAVAAPRLHHQWTPERAIVEGEVPQKVRDSLEARGHEVKVWSTFGATQAIALEGEQFYPVSEPRVQ